MMKGALRCSAQLTGGRFSVTPKLKHIRSADRVDLCIQEPSDHSGTWSVNQILPGQVKRNDIIPLSPDTLTKETRSVLDMMFLMFLSKSRSGLISDLASRRVSNVVRSKGAKTSTTCLASITQVVFNNGLKFFELVWR